jgi:hypothetical protein
MPFYVEFPADPVVNVHWRKKPKDPNDPGEPTDFRQTCGAFENGLIGGIPVGFSGIFILDAYFMYMRDIDQNPGHLPDKPYMYFPKTADYQSLGITPSAPYVWAAPSGGWTVTYHQTDTRPHRIREFRNVNLQVFNYENAAEDQLADNTLEIAYQSDGEIYPPFFMVEAFNTVTGWEVVPDPRVTVQAHCCPKPGASGCTRFETAGLPPQPPGWGTFFDPYTLWVRPMPGSTNDPVRPPPGARRRREPAQPVPPVVFPQRLEV